MPDMQQNPKRPSALLLWILVGLNAVVVPFNLYNLLARHPQASPAWVAIGIISAVLIFLGMGMMLWGRYRQKS